MRSRQTRRTSDNDTRCALGEPVDDVFGFSDEETVVVSEEEEVERPEAFWETVRVVREVQL